MVDKNPPLPLLSLVALSGLALTLSACGGVGQRPAAVATVSAPQDPSLVLVRHAVQALERGDSAAAVRLAELAVVGGPDNPQAYATLARASLVSGNFSAATLGYDKADQVAGARPEYQLGAALAQLAGGDREGALVRLSALRQSPALQKDVALAGDVGLALVLSGEVAEGLPLLERAARAPGVQARMRQNLAFAYTVAGQAERARAVAAVDLSAATLETHLAQWQEMATLSAPARTRKFLGSAESLPPRLRLAEPSTDPFWTTAPVAVTAPLTPAPSGVEAPPAPPRKWVTHLNNDTPSLLIPVATQTAPAPRDVALSLPDRPAGAPVAGVSLQVMPAGPLPVVPRPLEGALAVSALSEPRRSARPATVSATASKAVPLVPASRTRPKVFTPSSRVWTVQLGAYVRRTSLGTHWLTLLARHGGVLAGYKGAVLTGPKYTRLVVGHFTKGSAAQEYCATLSANGLACFVRSSLEATLAAARPLKG